ncbi:OsmC family protein [Dactylosporangium fulvum]|uniref:OsmC family protein n=1 Tax=Dactylosporangium fulvum TaxID=53359 RepID=A0ABY5VRQ1_9ACTN|nr:OsmC family protein [Dactylosporangium fulvum]UWP79872.1 OsmC family protein [Dactylosporangium fulvum]
MTARQPALGRDVNGIRAENRALIMEQLSDARRVREFSGPWDVEATWLTGFKSKATVRGHEIPFDQPGDIAADDTAPTPHEHLLASIAGCLIAGVVMHATVQNVRLTSLVVHVSGTFDNVLRWAGIESAGNPGYRGIDLRATMSGEADDDTLRDIWDRALAGSPVAQTINRETPVITIVELA